MAGTLYIVTTPIGNLNDLTPRAAATLAMVDFIAAEDTRVTRKLLSYLEISRPMISYHEHNAASQGPEILARVAAGENCALCSDAGTPAISDPGEMLVTEAHAMGITVVPVPAASAVITALCVSGQPTGRFVFEGFLPVSRKHRSARLAALKMEERTMVLYEAPHKLLATLQDLALAFGPVRSITLCRELTKLHEEIEKMNLEQAVAKYTGTAPRGEFVLVIEGAPPACEEAMSLEEAVAYALGLAQQQGLPAAKAARQAAGISGLPKSEIYRGMQNNETV